MKVEGGTDPAQVARGFAWESSDEHRAVVVEPPGEWVRYEDHLAQVRAVRREARREALEEIARRLQEHRYAAGRAGDDICCFQLLDRLDEQIRGLRAAGREGPTG